MKLSIGASKSSLSGNSILLAELRELFSFKDKAAEAQVRRFKDSLFYKERSLYDAHGELPDSYSNWKAARMKELRDAIHVYCCEWQDGNLIVPTGLVPRLLDVLQEKCIQPEITDTRDFDCSRRSLTGSKPRELRRPQVEALKLLTEKRLVGHEGLGLIRLATGTGKTALAQELIRAKAHRSIFLVPSISIMDQTIKRFEEAFGKKNVKAYGGGDKKIGYITVATYQSVYKGDPEDFKDIALAIFDECHHVSADTFYDVSVNKLAGSVHRYGLTAFEERADNSTMLIEAAVGPVVYQYDAPEAIADEYLARPTFVIYDVFKTQGRWTKYKIQDKKRIADKIEKSVEYNGKDDLIAYRNWVLGNDLLNQRIVSITNAMVEDGKSVLLLVDEKEHGESLQNAIPGAGFCFGGGKDNEALLKSFNKRELKVLIGTSSISEGSDTVPVDVLIYLKGGASKSQTLQGYGRALRNGPDENGVPQKPTTLIIDFNFPLCDLLNRHSQIREKIASSLGEVHHERAE